MQPLAFSKELLPVGSRIDESGVERPRAVSEYLLERMLLAGVRRICFVISPLKADIARYFGGSYQDAKLIYAVQDEPDGLCDAIFRAAPVLAETGPVLVGLPDTVWFPESGFSDLPDDRLAFLLFPVAHPELFDAVVTNEAGGVMEVQVKQHRPSTQWVWGAFKMPGPVFRDLHALWIKRERRDEFFGSLVNAYLAEGGTAIGVRTGGDYVDVGTLHGFREAAALVADRPLVASPLAFASFRSSASRKGRHP